MKKFFVSDLHLCDRGPRDNFQQNENAFYEFLHFVYEREGGLYLLGDVFDWWQCHPVRCMDAYWELCVKLEKLIDMYIVGNHDNLFSRANARQILPRPDWPLVKNGMSGPVTISVPSKDSESGYCHNAITIMHGHETDRYCRNPNPGIGNITAIASGLLEDRESIVDAEQKFMSAIEMSVKVWRTLMRKGDRLREMERGVEEFRQSKNIGHIIYGHTHSPGVTDEHNYNCGSWITNKPTYVVYDTESEKLEVKRWCGR